MPKVSVIVPIYNVEKYLEKCVNSLLYQSLKDIEILLINDGSKDSSGVIAQKYAQTHSNIFAFDKENGGLSDARNYGLDRASGEYIAFVDSDDYVEENMMQILYDLAVKHNAEMVICNMQKVDENGNFRKKITQLSNFDEKIDLETHFSLFSDTPCFACNKLFHKKLFENARFKKEVHFEDIDLIPQLLLKCTTIAKSDEYLYYYLQRSDSISKTHTEKGLDILEAIKSVETAFANSRYKSKVKALKAFQVFEGYYTFLAYLAFVKDEKLYKKMKLALTDFNRERGITKLDVLSYHNFGKNYLLSLPFKKKAYYLFHLLGIDLIIKKIL